MISKEKKQEVIKAKEIAMNEIPDEAMELHMSELRREKAYADRLRRGNIRG